MSPHMSCDLPVHDVDAHFHHITRDDWYMWTYGAKLRKAKTVNDPELHKLQILFHSLSEAANPDED